jgi:flagellar basal body rod protein FlgB
MKIAIFFVSHIFTGALQNIQCQMDRNEIQKHNLASVNTPETKTAKIHNAYIQNAQCQKSQFCCIATSSQYENLKML